MNATLLILLLSFGLSNLPDCDEFYKKELDPYAIDGKIIEKRFEDNYYILVIEQKNKKRLEIRLLPNMTGIQIYMFVKRDTIISVKKGSRSIHLVVPMSYGYEGKIFENLCQ